MRRRQESIASIAHEVGIDSETAGRMTRGSEEVGELRRPELLRAAHRDMQQFIDDLLETATGVRLATKPKRGQPNRPAVAHF